MRIHISKAVVRRTAVLILQITGLLYTFPRIQADHGYVSVLHVIIGLIVCGLPGITLAFMQKTDRKDTREIPYSFLVSLLLTASATVYIILYFVHLKEPTDWQLSITPPRVALSVVMSIGILFCLTQLYISLGWEHLRRYEYIYIALAQIVIIIAARMVDPSNWTEHVARLWVLVAVHTGALILYYRVPPNEISFDRGLLRKSLSVFSFMTYTHHIAVFADKHHYLDPGPWQFPLYIVMYLTAAALLAGAVLFVLGLCMICVTVKTIIRAYRE